MAIFIEDHPIDVFYYRAQPGSPLDKQARDALKLADDLITRANEYTKSKGAQDFCLETDHFAYRDERGFPKTGVVLKALRFVDEAKVPQDWRMDSFGRFSPPFSRKPEKNRDYEEMTEIKMPLVMLRAGGMVPVRFHRLGDDIILTASPNQDGTRPVMSEAEPLEKSDVDTLVLEASKDDSKGLESLSMFYWNFWGAARARRQSVSPEDLAALQRKESDRFHKHKGDSGYTPNPGGFMGGIRKALRFG